MGREETTKKLKKFQKNPYPSSAAKENSTFSKDVQDIGVDGVVYRGRWCKV